MVIRKFADVPVEDLFRFFDGDNDGILCLSDAQQICKICGFSLVLSDVTKWDKTTRITLHMLNEALEDNFMCLKNHDHNRMMFSLLSNKETGLISFNDLKLFFKDIGDDINPKFVTLLAEYINWFDDENANQNPKNVDVGLDEECISYAAFTGFLNYMQRL